MLFLLAVTFATGILFGLIPALQATRTDVAPILKDQARRVVGSSAPVRLRKVLVMAQVSLSLLLLIGAGLFIRSLQNLRDEIPIQMFVPYLATRWVGGMTLYLKTSVDSNQIASAVRAQTRQLDPNVPIYGMRTVEEQISNSLLIERLIASLSTVFGVIATLLATIGLYGVMAYTVARRTREIGIRMALGAFQGDVIWMVMREVIILVVIGMVVGFGAAMGLTQYVKSQLFGLTTMDPGTLAAAMAGLAAVGCLAGFFPALRASRVDAMQALRDL